MLSHSLVLLSVLVWPQLSSVSVQSLSAHRPAIKRLLCKPQNPGVPAYQQEIDVSSLRSCNALVGPTAGPWSGVLSPDGQSYYMTLGGGSGVENCLIAKVDVQTKQVVATLSVGLFPQEMTFTTAPGGAMQYGFVTNSSSGSVSVFDAADQVIANIQLPDTQSFGTCYPFGIAVSKNQSRIYVGTLDGSGDIYAIDTQTLSLLPAETLQVTGSVGHGKLAFHGNTLLIPVTEYDPFFTYSIAKMVFVNPANPAGATTITMPSSGLYPSPQDVAVRCDGRVYVAGLDLESKIFVFDAVQKTLLHTIDSTTAVGYHQGLGLSSRGLLAVGDYASNEIVFFNVWNEQWVASFDLYALPQPHIGPFELVFSKNGKELLVPNYYSDSLAVFQIP